MGTVPRRWCYRCEEYTLCYARGCITAGRQLARGGVINLPPDVRMDPRVESELIADGYMVVYDQLQRWCARCSHQHNDWDYPDLCCAYDPLWVVLRDQLRQHRWAIWLGGLVGATSSYVLAQRNVDVERLNDHAGLALLLIVVIWGVCIATAMVKAFDWWDDR